MNISDNRETLKANNAAQR